MKRLSTLLLLLTTASPLFAQNSDSLSLKSISNEIMMNGKCYEDLRVLTKTVGHRLSGSPAAEKAVQWGKKTLEAAGAEKVWLQPVDVPFWIRGTESLKVQLHDNQFVAIPMLSLGNTDGTNGKLLEQDIICLPDMEAIDKMPAAQVKGKIIFFNYKFRQDKIGRAHV